MSYTATNIIQTVKEKCKVCYTCVRECPAKAIKVEKGQASIIAERCIHCGNCVKVCSQNAKEIVSSLPEFENLLLMANKQSEQVACLLAPSFAAEFLEIPLPQFFGMLERIGFSTIYEVGLGADIVAKLYREKVEANPSFSYISSTCPSIVSYIEKNHQELVSHLMPLPSPMMVMGEIVKDMYKKEGKAVKTVFIGPCAAKKREIAHENKNAIDLVLTFKELREMFKQRKVFPTDKAVGKISAPYAYVGNLFALSSGLLQTAGLDERLIAGNFISADGKGNFIEAIREFKQGDFSPSLLDTLCCQGCIMGPGMTCKAPLYKRRNAVAKYVRERLQETTAMPAFNGSYQLREERKFNPRMVIQCVSNEAQVQTALMGLKKHAKSDELNCGACGYDTCLDHARAIASGFAEPEMCLPYTIDRLKETIKDLEYSYRELKSVKETLGHREKLASMGQLSAGIAHELNNPLGVILMYAHLLLEDSKHIKDEDREDMQMIVEQAQRCKRIVSGLLNFSRQNKVIRVAVEMNKLVQLVIDSLSIPSMIKVVVDDQLVEKTIELDKDQISQALINLINNAIDALGESNGEIKIVLKDDPNQMFIIIQDNGPGIPQSVRGRIFDPFFTTKQMGKGTGLGLPVCYGIVKMHSGAIDVQSVDEQEYLESNRNKPRGTVVKITLPKIHE